MQYIRSQWDANVSKVALENIFYNEFTIFCLFFIDKWVLKLKETLVFNVVLCYVMLLHFFSKILCSQWVKSYDLLCCVMICYAALFYEQILAPFWIVQLFANFFLNHYYLTTTIVFYRTLLVDYNLLIACLLSHLP